MQDCRLVSLLANKFIPCEISAYRSVEYSNQCLSDNEPGFSSKEFRMPRKLNCSYEFLPRW